MTILDRIEKTGHNEIEGNFVIVSFDTKYKGIWQCKWNIGGMSEFSSEPPFESLRQEEQTAIKLIGPIVYYFSFDEVPTFK